MGCLFLAFFFSGTCFPPTVVVSSVGSLVGWLAKGLGLSGGDVPNEPTCFVDAFDPLRIPREACFLSQDDLDALKSGRVPG